jgi:Subtilase family/Secretion system C-terminal sorting domain
MGIRLHVLFTVLISFVFDLAMSQKRIEDVYASYSTEREAVKNYLKRTNIPPSFVSEEGVRYEIRYIHNNVPVYDITHNQSAAKSIGVDKLQPGSSLGLGLTGVGIKAAIWDGGNIRLTHQEFGNRISQSDATGTDFDVHATHVSGTILASGANPLAKGMAIGANLFAFDFNNDVSEMTAVSKPDKSTILVSNHSYGTLAGWDFKNNVWTWYGDPSISNTKDYKFGFYDNTAAIWDNIAFNAPYYTIVKSGGNDRDDVGDGSRSADGPFDCISTYGNAKNIVTVGAVNKITNYSSPQDVQISSFSSWGPTDDGRIKPDLVAPGINLFSSSSLSDQSYTSLSGTSMSAPCVSGAFILIQQLYAQLHPGEYLKSSTLKALAIHTAKEAGSNPGPDYSFGWGLLDAEAMAKIILAEDNQNTIIKNLQLSNNSVYELPLNPKPNEKITITLVWTDPAGIPVQASLNPTNPMLVNDLDLRLFDDAQTAQFPWILDPANPANAALRGDNFRDNVEKLELESPQPRSYKLRVSHKQNLKNNQSQDFSLIITYTSQTDPRVSYYWVNGDGNWNDGSHWSNSSGGVAVNSIPSKNDRVIFDENSFSSPNFTVVTTENTSCYSFYWFSKRTGNLSLSGNTLEITENLLIANGSLKILSSGVMHFTNNTSGDFSIFLGDSNNNLKDLSFSFTESNVTRKLVGNATLDKLVFNSGSFIIDKSSLSINAFNSSGLGRKKVTINQSIIASNQSFDVSLQNTLFASNNSSFVFKENSNSNSITTDKIAFKAKIYLQKNSMSINGLGDYPFIDVKGSVLISGTHQFDSLYLHPGSDFFIEQGTTQVITSNFSALAKVDSMVTIKSQGSQKSFLELEGYYKKCFDFINVKNVDLIGQSLVNLGTNSTVINSLNWSQFDCNAVLFPDFSYKYACNDSYIYFEDKSEGQISNRRWDFPDDTFSSEVNPKKLFSQNQNIMITLTVSNGATNRSIAKAIALKSNQLPTNSIVMNSDLLLSFNPSPSYQWLINNNFIELEKNRSIKFVGNPGTYKVLTFNEDCNKVSSPFLITSIEEPALNNEYSVYPNPFNETITIEIKNEGRISLFGSLGNEILSSEGNHKVDINTSNLKKGIYFLLIRTNNSVHYSKLLKE